MTSSSASQFDRQRHIKYFAKHLQVLPQPYTTLDTNRLTLVHFAVHALDMLHVWDNNELMIEYNILDKQYIIDWIYALQVNEPKQYAGFKGGTFLGGSFGLFCCSCDNNNNHEHHHQQQQQYDAKVVGPPLEYNHGHIAMTYTALCTLTMLGDDLSRLNKTYILQSLKTLQRDIDGSFHCIHVGSEHDTRFLFCACAISHMLNDWSSINIDKAVDYIQKCRSFDGAIALIPGQVS